MKNAESGNANKLDRRSKDVMGEKKHPDRWCGRGSTFEGSEGKKEIGSVGRNVSGIKKH